MDNISFLTAIFAGILSFASPCVLPLIPAYISYISGVSLQEMKEGQSSSSRLFINSIAFVIGFSVVFITLGASATVLGKILSRNKRIFDLIAGIIVMIFGLHTSQVIRIKFLSFEKKIKVRNKTPSFLSSFILGFTFSFGWTPCVGPILGTILVQASTYSTVKQGILLLTLYSLGLGIPFILTALAINKFFTAFKSIRKFFSQIELFAGLLIVGVGLALVFGTGLYSSYILSIILLAFGFALLSTAHIKLIGLFGIISVFGSLFLIFKAKINIQVLPIMILIFVSIISLYRIGVRENE